MRLDKNGKSPLLLNKVHANVGGLAGSKFNHVTLQNCTKQIHKFCEKYLWQDV